MKVKNSLADLFPEIAAQWDNVSNEPSKLNQISAHSNKKYYWICENGHSYISSPDKRVSGRNCPYCSNKKVLVGFNDLDSQFPSIAKEWDYLKNVDTPKDYTVGSTYKANWKCSKCGKEWVSSIRTRVKSTWKLCPECTKIKRGQVRYERILLSKGSITNPLLIKEWDYERNDKGPEEYTGKSNAEVYWICSKCGYRFKSKISNRTNRNGGCACCSGKKVVKGINDLNTTHPLIAQEWHPTKNGELTPFDVTYGMAKRVWWICSEGHEYQATLNHRSGGTNCPKCNSGRQTSFAEQAVFFYIKKIFPDAINRYREIFDNGMELDIYIPSIKLAIEYDGMFWHNKSKLDREKRKYEICRNNNIKLLRLREDSSSMNSLIADECLGIEGNMYDPKQLEKVIRILLDKIDPESNLWTRKDSHNIHSKVDINIKKDELLIRSYMTKILNNSLAYSFPQIAKEWNYDKNGELVPDKVKPHSDISVWWVCPTCKNEYKASIGHRTLGTGCPKCGITKSAQKRSKAVLMCDCTTKNVIREFHSISEASRVTKINVSNISMSCKGSRKTAGGYIWKYLDNE